MKRFFAGKRSFVIIRCLWQQQANATIRAGKEETLMIQENLKAQRLKKGLSQEELAAQIHVVRQTVSKWEKGVSQT